MKYYNTGKEGFMKAWYNACLKNWYLILISVILFTITLNTLSVDLTTYNTQQIVLGFMIIILLDIGVIQMLLDNVLEYMEEHDYMTTDKNRKNCYKKIEFITDDKMHKDHEL